MLPLYYQVDCMRFLVVRGFHVQVSHVWRLFSVAGVVASVIVLVPCVAVLLAALRLLQLRIWRAFSSTFKQLRGLPGPKPHWLTGNLRELQRGYSNIYMQWRKEYGRTYKVHFGPMTLAVFTSDPVLIKEVCKTLFKYFHDRPISPYTFVRREGLLTGRGDYWAGVRSAVLPLFHTQQLRNFGDVMHRQASVLVGKLESLQKGQKVELVDWLQAFTFDIIGEAAFGMEFGQQTAGGNKQDLARVIKEVLREGTKFRASVIVAMFFPSLKSLAQRFFALFPGSADCKQYLRWEYITRECLTIAADRRKDPMADSYNDFLTLLTKARTKGTGRALTDSEVRTLVFEFLVAGSETTANTLSFAIAMLSKNPEVEEKMLEEIDRVSCECTHQAAENSMSDAGMGEVGASGDAKCAENRGSALHPTYLELSRFPFVEQVLQETLRMYPVAGFLLRETQQDCVVAGKYSFAKGVCVGIPVYALHHDPDYYPNPEAFRPERFDPNSDELKNRNPNTYLPFGLGGHMCIGYRFAMEEGRLALIRLYQRFTFRLVDEERALELAGSGSLLRLKNGLWVTVHPRRGRCEHNMGSN